MNEPLAYLIGLFIFFLLLLLLWIKRRSFAGIRAKPLLTPNELEFFGRLSRALPHRLIFTQVSFSAFLTTDPALSLQRKLRLRGHFSQKYADFLVCDKQTLSIIAIVELDDRTHNIKKDKRCDQILKTAGYRVVRFLSSQKPSEKEITTLLG